MLQNPEHWTFKGRQWTWWGQVLSVSSTRPHVVAVGHAAERPPPLSSPLLPPPLLPSPPLLSSLLLSPPPLPSPLLSSPPQQRASHRALDAVWSAAQSGAESVQHTAVCNQHRNNKTQNDDILTDTTQTNHHLTTSEPAPCLRRSLL